MKQHFSIAPIYTAVVQDLLECHPLKVGEMEQVGVRDLLRQKQVPFQCSPHARLKQYV